VGTADVAGGVAKATWRVSVAHASATVVAGRKRPAAHFHAHAMGNLAVMANLAFFTFARAGMPTLKLRIACSRTRKAIFQWEVATGDHYSMVAIRYDSADFDTARYRFRHLGLMAFKFFVDMSARQLHVCNRVHALWIAQIPTGAKTRMRAVCFQSLASLETTNRVVKNVGMALIDTRACPHRRREMHFLLQPPSGESIAKSSGVWTSIGVSGCLGQQSANVRPRLPFFSNISMTSAHIGIVLAVWEFPIMYMPCRARLSKALIRFDVFKKPHRPSSFERTRDMTIILASSP